MWDKCRLDRICRLIAMDQISFFLFFVLEFCSNLLVFLEIGAVNLG